MRKAWEKHKNPHRESIRKAWDNHKKIIGEVQEKHKGSVRKAKENHRKSIGKAQEQHRKNRSDTRAESVLVSYMCIYIYTSGKIYSNTRIISKRAHF